MAVRSVRARELTRSRFKANPYPFYARLRAESPVCRVAAFGFRAWLVTRYDDVVAMLQDDRLSNDISSRMPWIPRFTRPLTEHLLNRDPPDHTRLRKLVTRAFTPSRVEALRGRVTSLCEQLLEPGGRHGRMDLVEGYALPLPITIISELLGVPEAGRRRFHALSRSVMRIGAPSRLADVTLTLPDAWRLIRFFRRLFAERRARPADDLLSALIQAEEDGDRLSERELLAMVVLVLLAGYETTVGLIAGGVLALLENPEQRAAFVEGGVSGRTAIEELLRYTSPVEITMPRIAREEVRIGPVSVGRGEIVAAVLGSANRDESRFREPDRLDLTRDPNPHLGFGNGRHFCLGATLARMEAELALTLLFRRFPEMRLARPAATLRWRELLPMRSLDELPVSLR